MKKSIFRTFSALLLSLIISSSFSAGKDIQKTFTWKYNINKDGQVTMENYDCNLVIHTWDKGEAEFRLTIEAETRSDEEAATLDKYLQDLTFSNSPSSISFRSRFWDSRTTIMNRSTMKLAGGKTITLNSFTMKGELWIPVAGRFSLNSRYSQVNMEDFTGSLKLDLYNNNFYGGSVSSAAEITDKYSTIELGDLKDARLNLYNSKVSARNTGNLTFESKYSRINILSCSRLSANSYNDKYEVPKTGDVAFTGKYSDLKTETSANVTADMYNGTLTMTELKDVKIVSKYGEFQFANAGICTISTSYNDKVTIGKLASLGIAQSKYTTIRVEYLAESLEDKDSYNDKFTISEFGRGFSGLNLTGKYVNVSATLPKSTSYRFKANVRYADFDIDEASLKPVVKIIEGSNTKYDAVKGTETAGMPVVEVNGYDITLKLSEK